MRHLLLAPLIGVFLAAVSVAQVDRLPQSGKPPANNQAPPRSEPTRSTGESSSKDTQIDLSPPADDAKNHPLSNVGDDTLGGSDEGIQEMRPWDPHRAAKNIEVGDFYFKKKNYRAAMDRYQEALEYKPDDALANFHIAQCLEKLNDPQSALDHYQKYLKVLPQGEFAAEAKKAIEKIQPAAKDSAAGQVPPK